MDMALHEQMIEAIVAVASELPSAIHVANCIQKLLCVPAHGSAMNFHYAIPSALRENWHLGVIIGEGETSFRGNSAGSYRSEAWSFLLAGRGYLVTSIMVISRKNVPQQSLMLGIPAGRYVVEWLHPASWMSQTAATIDYRGGFVRIDTPCHTDNLGFVGAGALEVTSDASGAGDERNHFVDVEVGSDVRIC